MEEIVIRNVSEILSDLGQKYRQPQMKLRQMTLRGTIKMCVAILKRFKKCDLQLAENSTKPGTAIFSNGIIR